MKKILGLMVAVILCLPFMVSAKIKLEKNIIENCSQEGSVITCDVNVQIDEDSATNEIDVIVTERGGATIVDVLEADPQWSLETPLAAKENGVQKVTVKSSESVAGEFTLFKVSYTPSGEEDCEILFSLSSNDPATGATLPYIALGVIALGAIGAYLATKNKSKMYRI